MTTSPLPASQSPSQSPSHNSAPPADPADTDTAVLRLGLPKGRMHDGVVGLLADAGIRLGRSARGYRPTISLPGVEVKILKPQNIVQMLDAGTRDLGFAGADWVAELGSDLVELLDTGLDDVRIVVACPEQTLDRFGGLPTSEQLGRPLRIAGEMERLTRTWMSRKGLVDGQHAVFVRTYGATEVFPPEDADCIVDITQTGSTLEANGLSIIDEVMTSSTRLYASPEAMDNPAKRSTAEDIAMLMRSVLAARGRVMIEVNVPAGSFETVCDLLPCMREPTVAELHGGGGFAVKAAVPRSAVPALVPRLKAAGGSDIIVSPLSQVVP